jgi:uncharacterized membrane protein YdbT with pleckstrin-like domain
MPFPRKLLAPHEEMVLDLRPHWIALFLPLLFTVLLGVATVLLYNLPKNPSSAWENGVVIVALVAWLFLSVLPFLKWLFTNFALTTDRLITRTGIIAKHSREIPLERINDVTFNQSILERALGAGSLLIESAGERGQEKISHVRHPEQVQLQIYQETEKNNDRMMNPGGGSTSQPESVTSQIEALAKLRDQGAITPTEFDAKKTELLKRL